MTVPDHSIRRRLAQLERQLAELSHEVRTPRQATPSHRSPRETWLGRVAESPTPGADDNVYAVELLSCTFEAASGEQWITEHARGSTVYAATWPARSLEAGQDVIVHRIRGALAGDTEDGEWWIPGDAAIPQSRDIAVFQGRARLAAYSGATDYATTNDDAFVFFPTWRESGDARITPQNRYSGGVYGDSLLRLDGPGYWRVTASLTFLGDYTGTLPSYPGTSGYPDSGANHTHEFSVPKPHWVRPWQLIRTGATSTTLDGGTAQCLDVGSHAWLGPLVPSDRVPGGASGLCSVMSSAIVQSVDEIAYLGLHIMPESSLPAQGRISMQQSFQQLVIEWLGDNFGSEQTG